MFTRQQLLLKLAVKLEMSEDSYKVIGGHGGESNINPLIDPPSPYRTYCKWAPPSARYCHTRSLALAFISLKSLQQKNIQLYSNAVLSVLKDRANRLSNIN